MRADAVLMGTPTRYGNVASQLEQFLDGTGGFLVPPGAAGLLTPPSTAKPTDRPARTCRERSTRWPR